VGVIVIATVIVAVHVHGNDTVEVIATVDDSAPRQVNGSDHDQGGVHVQVHGHDHGPDHINVNAARSRSRSRPARRGIVRNHESPG